MRPAYDLTDPEGAYRFLQNESRRVRFVPSGYEVHYAGYAVNLHNATRWPGDDGPLTADEALAGLRLLRAVSEWAEEITPALIAAARHTGTTWEQLAPVLGVADRRAAHRKYDRLTRDLIAGLDQRDDDDPVGRP